VQTKEKIKIKSLHPIVENIIEKKNYLFFLKNNNIKA
jgi:hypothetical protein